MVPVPQTKLQPKNILTFYICMVDFGIFFISILRYVQICMTRTNKNIKKILSVEIFLISIFVFCGPKI